MKQAGVNKVTELFIFVTLNGIDIVYLSFMFFVCFVLLINLYHIHCTTNYNSS